MRNSPGVKFGSHHRLGRKPMQGPVLTTYSGVMFWRIGDSRTGGGSVTRQPVRFALHGATTRRHGLVLSMDDFFPSRTSGFDKLTPLRSTPRKIEGPMSLPFEGLRALSLSKRSNWQPNYVGSALMARATNGWPTSDSFPNCVSDG